MSSLFFHRIHGLNILSPLALKKEQDFFMKPDITLQWIAKMPQLPECTESHLLHNQAGESQAVLCKYTNGALSIDYFECGFFYVQNSTLFVLQNHLDDDFFVALLTTQILPLLSSLHRVTLHGGVVVKKDRAVIYLGHEGVGKSTLATYLLQNDFNIYSDDVAAIEIDSAVRVHSGLPEIRLNEDSCQNLLPKDIHPTLPLKLAKQQLSFSQSGSAVATVVAIFILSPQKTSSPQEKISLSASQSFAYLIQNQFRWDIWNPKVVTNEFAVLASVCQQVPFWKLQYPLAYESLPWISHQIEGSLHAQRENVACLRELL